MNETRKGEREAGRELDAEVAERILGTVWDEKRCRVCGWPLAGTQSVVEAHCLPDNCSQRPAPVLRADRHAPFSTDIATAFLLPDALDRATGRDLGISINGNSGDGYWVRFYDTSPLGYVGQNGDIPGLVAPEVHVASLPLAICIAALKALDASTPPSAVEDPSTAESR